MSAKEEALLRLKGNLCFPWRKYFQQTVVEDARAYAAAAIAEARAPLVEILQNAVSCPSCWIIKGQPHDPDCPVAAALAKETP